MDAAHRTPTASIRRLLAVTIIGPVALSLVVESAPVTSNSTAIMNAIAPETPDLDNTIPLPKEMPSPDFPLGDSDFSGDGEIVLDKKEPCEAGFPCGDDQWCSPSRRVCRPCTDVEQFCDDTLMIHTRFPACESFCYQILQDQTQTCQTQKDALQNSFDDKVSAFNSLTQKTAKLKEDYKTAAQELEREKEERYMATQALETEKEKYKEVTLELEKQHKISGDQNNIIVALAIVAAISFLWAFGASFVLWYHFFRSPDLRKIGIQGVPDMPPRGIPEKGTLLAIEAQPKTPIQDNTMDSGDFCGNKGQSGIRLTGNNELMC